MTNPPHTYADEKFSLLLNGAYILSGNFGTNIQNESHFKISEGGHWTPTANDIKILEKALFIFLEKRQKDREKLPANTVFERQYVGVTKDEKSLFTAIFIRQAHLTNKIRHLLPSMMAAIITGPFYMTLKMEKLLISILTAQDNQYSQQPIKKPRIKRGFYCS